jgi:hypothetical protein
MIVKNLRGPPKSARQDKDSPWKYVTASRSPFGTAHL